MEVFFGIPLSTWDRNLGDLLEERGTREALNESEEDSYLPWFVTRTLCAGLREGSLADLALLIAYDDGMIGCRMSAYAKRALYLASGLVIVWTNDATYAEMEKLDQAAD
ncbi:MAG: hypothetical protein M3R13_09340 [Armatimonadota bacterium]|nr:hypothetical protein [Armatimonadota bacterium]